MPTPQKEREPSPFMTTEEVAVYGRTTTETCRYWRHVSKGPRSFKVGRRVLYRREDVEAYFAAAYESAGDGAA